MISKWTDFHRVSRARTVNQFFSTDEQKKSVSQKKKKCFELKVQSFKLHNNKYVITSTQIKNITIFAFIAILVFKLLSLESRLLFKKIGNHTGKLLQNYK